MRQGVVEEDAVVLVQEDVVVDVAEQGVNLLNLFNLPINFWFVMLFQVCIALTKMSASKESTRGR